jgi:hypothetical protein
VPLPLLIILVIFGLILFVGIPMSLLYQQYQNRKKADGTYAAGVIIDRTGTSGRVLLMPKEKERLVDREKTVVNPDGKANIYFATKGYLINLLWPPQRSKFFQNSMPFGIWVEGHDEPVDLMGQFREKEKAGKLDRVDSSRLVGDIVDEKVTGEVVHFADSVAELRKQMEEALSKGSRGQLLSLFVGGITILALIIIAVLMVTKMGHMSSDIKDMKAAIEGMIGTPATP